jgi:RHS repeat-associated protein
MVALPPTTFEYEGVNVNYTQGSQTIQTQFVPFSLTKETDHWGFQNGAISNNNNVLNTPSTTVTIGASTLTAGNSDRSTNPLYLKDGTLKKIIYPTGGSTAYEFEENKVQTEWNSSSTTNVVNLATCNAPTGCCATNSVEQTLTLTTDDISTGLFNLYTISKIPLVTWSGIPGDPTFLNCQSPPYQVIYKLEVFNIVSNASTLFFTKEFNTTITVVGSVYSNGLSGKLWEFANFIPGQTYKFKLTMTNGYGTFDIKKPVFQANDVAVGGLRVKKITLNDGISTINDVVRTYEYSSASDATKSSGRLFRVPNYGYGGEFSGSPCALSCSTVYMRILATSITPLGSYQGYHVGYQRVIENHGTTSTVNGRKIFTFNTETGGLIPTTPIPNIPDLPTVKNGTIISETTQNSSGTTLQESRQTSDQDVHIVNYPSLAYKWLSIPMCNSVAIPIVVYYPLRTTQYRIISSTETQDGVVSTTTMDYNDNATLRRTQPRYISSVNSDGKTTKVEQLFAYDYGLNSNTKIKLEALNLIGRPYQVSNYVNNIQISGTQTEYGLVNSSTYVWDNSTTTGTIPYPRYFRNYESVFGVNGQPTGSGNWVTQGEVLEYYTTGLAKKYLTAGWASTDFEEFTWANGLITQSKFKNFTKTYDYYTGTKMPSAITAIDGQKVWYDYDALMRLQKVWARPSTANTKATAQVTNEYQYKYIDGSTPRNYVRTIATYGAVAGSSISTIENSTYMDGLGREVQTVGKKASPSQNDIINVVTYDNQGRVVRKYVPFVVSGNTGAFVPNPLLSLVKFTENTYEASPLNRGLTATPPGWYASTITYGANIATDNVKKDLGTGTLYSANDLFKTTATDPNGNKMITFNDKKGRTILTRKTDNAGTNIADTYNIFDDKDRLMTVVPPGALLSETNSIFSYTYDPSDNMLTKKVPGKGLEKMAYDARDLLTFYQDNVMSATPRWMMTKYNAYGQATSTGFWNGTTPPTDNTATAFNELLTETLYDDATAIFKGRIKQTKVKILDGAATPKWLENNFTYDSHGRTSQINGNSHINLTLGSEVIDFNTYDWADNVIQKTRTHKKTTTSTLTLRDRYTYDHRARMNNYYHKIDAGTEVLVSNQVYSDRNFLTQKNLHGTTGGGYLQNVDYYYNDQGWLTGINTMCLSGAAAAASAPPPASASNIQVKLFTVANQLNGSANEAKTYFGTSVSADIKVDGVPKTIAQTDYFVVEKPGTEAAVWQKTDNLPAGIVLNTSVSVGMDGMYLDQNSDFSDFYLKVEKLVTGKMVEQGIAMEKATPVANAVQTALDQVLTPVSAAAAAPAMAAALTASTSSDLFSMGLFYNTTNTTLGAPLQKNGNISHIWSQVACNNPQYYGFQYDFLDRLTTANNAEYNTSTAAYINTNRYNESSTFDLRGNITSVIRRGMTATNTFGVIDNMGYTYVATDKNRVNGILDVASTTKGFKVLNASQQLYTYDNNGNMSRDNHKKMSTTYFYHNMPKTITFDNGNTINWLYDASGNKLTKTTSAATNNVTHYLGGIEYVGTAATFNLEAIYHTEGRCTPQAGNTWRYEYNIRDHLGNTRVTFADLDNSGTVTTSEMLQQNHYYPFGANIEGLTTTSPNKYQYNGKEWNADFGLEWNDYGARFYDPWVGRWWGVDPLADEYSDYTTYNYAVDSPVNFIDPNGMSSVSLTYSRGHDLEVANRFDQVQRLEERQYKNNGVLGGPGDPPGFSSRSNAQLYGPFLAPFVSFYDYLTAVTPSEANRAGTESALGFINLVPGSYAAQTLSMDNRGLTWLTLGFVLLDMAGMGTGKGLSGSLATRNIELGFKINPSLEFRYIKNGDRVVNRIYSARELIRRSKEPGPYHNFPEAFNNVIFENGTKIVTPNYFNTAKRGLSNTNILYQYPGIVNGRQGLFEIATRPSISGRTEVINHRFFNPAKK